jgi:hypothetical protein
MLVVVIILNLMEKKFMIYNFMTKSFYCGDYGTILEWSVDFYNAEFYSEKEDAERYISTLSDGLYQIIEVYRP